MHEARTHGFVYIAKSGNLQRVVLWAYSSAWLERFPDKEEVCGSSPHRPTLHTTRGPSSIGRAPPLQGGG